MYERKRELKEEYKVDRTRQIIEFVEHAAQRVDKTDCVWGDQTKRS